MKIISAVFHPLLICSYSCFILIEKAPNVWIGISQDYLYHFWTIIFIITCLIPALCVFLLKVFSVISDLEITHRKERLLPFLLIITCYTVGTYFILEKIDLEGIFIIIMVSITLLQIILAITTKWIKISIHSTAIWASAGFFTGLILRLDIDLSYVFYLWLMACGITSSSRIYLGYHTPKEVWTGSFLGFFYGVLTILLLV